MKINANIYNKLEYTMEKMDIRELLSKISSEIPKPAILMGTPTSSDSTKYIMELMIKILQKEVFENVKFIPISYTTVNPKGEYGYQANALMVIPPVTDPDQRLPILSYQHGTLLERQYAPSYFNPDRWDNTNFIEVCFVAMLAASRGYLTIMADYQGMHYQEKGQRIDCTHPYVVAKPLGRCVVDLIKHVIDKELKIRDIKWNGQIFMTGYSEGGFVTMAASKEIQENFKDINITASAPCAGPYSISQSMRILMLREDIYGDAFFLPMTLKSYNEVYGERFSAESSLRKDMRCLYDLVDGYHSRTEVNDKMEIDGRLVPRNVMSEAIINELSDKRSKVYNDFMCNDLYRWKPKMPMRLYHNFNDDRVPYENSIIASQWFKKKGIEVPVISVLGLPLPDNEHIRGFIPCLMDAIGWFDTYAYGYKDTLEWGQPLYHGHALVSKGNKYSLRYQEDGTLAIYCLESGNITWQWNSQCPTGWSSELCLLKKNGNLVLYGKNNKKIKQQIETGRTSEWGGCKLVIHDNGQGVVYDRENSVVYKLNEL